MAQLCHHCHQKIAEHEAVYIRGRNIVVCPKCAEDIFPECDCCHRHFSEADLLDVGSQQVCIWCVTAKFVLCPHCGEFFPPDQVINFHGHYMCPACQAEYFGVCAQCGQKFEVDELTEVSRAGQPQLLCAACAADAGVFCCACHEWVTRSAAIAVGDQFLCPDCAQFEATRCARCRNYVLEDDIETVTTAHGELDLCPKCAGQLQPCAECDTYFNPEELFEFEGEKYCRNCLRELIQQLDAAERRAALLALGTVAAVLFSSALLSRWLGPAGRSASGILPPGNLTQDYDYGTSDGEFTDDPDAPDDFVGDGLDADSDYDL